MRHLITTLWHRNRFALIAFGAAVALTLFFAAKLVLFAPHWMGPRPEPGPIAGWMTPKFLVHAYHLPRDGLAETLGYAFETENPQTLQQIAMAKGVPLTHLIARIEAEIDDMKQGDHRQDGDGPKPDGLDPDGRPVEPDHD